MKHTKFGLSVTDGLEKKFSLLSCVTYQTRVLSNLFLKIAVDDKLHNIHF